MPANQSQDFWILSLSGGGYRGLFTATVLAEMERRAGVSLATKFDLIAGTSVGSILAAALAKEIPANDLPTFFLRHGKEIFQGGWKQLPVVGMFNLGWFSSRYGSRGLQEVLSDQTLLGTTTFSELRHRLMIPAVNLSKGSGQFFKTQHHQDYTNDGRISLIDAVMASAAAPTYFPVHRFNDNRYVDGGLIANSPAFVAFHEAHYKLQQPVDRIHVISVGTMNRSVTIDAKSPLSMGLLTSAGLRPWMGWRQRIFEVTLAAQEEMTGAMLRHALPDRVLPIDHRLTDDQGKNVGLDRLTVEANETLQGQAREVAKACLVGSLYEKWLKHSAATPQFFNQV